MSKKPKCPGCGATDSLVLECTGYWSEVDRAWVLSEGNNDPVWCNGGDDQDCDWEGYLSDLKWVET